MFPHGRFLPVVCAAFLLVAGLLRAEPELPAYLSKKPTASTVLDEKFNALLDKIRAKVQAGENTEMAFAPELKEFDALIAQYDDKTSDKIAFLAVMKDSLYLDVFQEPIKGIAMLKQTRADYSTTKMVAKIDALIAKAQAPKPSPDGIGTQMVPFIQDDLYDQPFNLDDYKGHTVLVYFWATTNETCVQEAPTLQAAYAKYHAKGFEIVGISLDTDRLELVDFLRTTHLPWRQFFDGHGMKNRLAIAYGIDAIPANFLIDGQGRILAKNVRGDALDGKLSAVLK